MLCREKCGACCIAPSITSPIPGMPQGKPANQLCIQLDAQYRCKIFGKAERPKVCAAFAPAEDICGESREQALFILQSLESATR